MNYIYLKGHHGTDLDSSEEILKSNYQKSIGDEHWLGDGVYFFINGLSCDTQNLAKEWAKAQSWDNENKKYKYTNIVVLESEIQINKENLLDLTQEEGIKILIYLVDRYLNVLRKTGKGLDFYDGLLINMARDKGILPIDIVKGNFYIKFEKERKYKINLRTCNCTICVVFDPTKNIISTKKKQVEPINL